MKTNRLIEMTLLLLNKENITAKELSERFGVSTRTIYRDIEELSLAGVPVYMSQGKGGGISLLEDYSLNKTLLSKADKESLILTLKTLEATKYPQISSVIEKISALFRGEEMEDWVQVEFSQWGSRPGEEEKFGRLKEAILGRQLIGFEYINAWGGRTQRQVEPMKLMFKGQAWYLYGYCRQKQDFRVFRITRIKELELLMERFVRRAAPPKTTLEFQGTGKNILMLRLRFREKALHRVYDDFEEENITANGDGTIDVSLSFPEDEWVYGYILSFGSAVEVLEPQRVRELIVERMREAIRLYEK